MPNFISEDDIEQAMLQHFELVLDHAVNHRKWAA